MAGSASCAFDSAGRHGQQRSQCDSRLIALSRSDGYGDGTTEIQNERIGALLEKIYLELARL
jgi:hypothetical protein